MLKNLYKTWGILAPDEVTFWDNGEAITLEKNQPPCHTWVTVKPWLDGQDALLGYILRCIHNRKVYCSLQQDTDYCKADVQLVLGDPCQFGRHTEACYEVLLFAYLKALAAQRPITKSHWQHFKGGEMDVLGIASQLPLLEVALGSGLQFFAWPYLIEEDPKKSVQLVETVTGKFFYLSEEDYGDRVFYQERGHSNWARIPESFLGLVGAEYPESEGLLRFVEVGH